MLETLTLILLYMLVFGSVQLVPLDALVVSILMRTHKVLIGPFSLLAHFLILLLLCVRVCVCGCRVSRPAQ